MMECHILHFQDRSPHDDILQLISMRKIKALHVEASCLSVVMNWWYNLSLYWYSNRKTCPMVCQYILFRLTKACLMCVNDVSYVRLCPYVLLTVSINVRLWYLSDIDATWFVECPCYIVSHVIGEYILACSVT
jgi:hypothetical protein